jgi:hypothetical protein
VVNEADLLRTWPYDVIQVACASPLGQNRLTDVEPFWRSHLESAGSFTKVRVMSRVVKRSVAGAIKTGEPRGGQDATLSLPDWIPPQLCQPVEKAPSGPQWLHEIKLDGFRMAARIDRGRAQLLTRTGLDWSDKYPSAATALANVRAKTAYRHHTTPQTVDVLDVIAGSARMPCRGDVGVRSGHAAANSNSKAVSGPCGAVYRKPRYALVKDALKSNFPSTPDIRFVDIKRSSWI